MSSRVVHMDRSIFTSIGEPLTIPDQSIIEFTHQLCNYHKKIIINGVVSDINKIEFNYITNVFKINTSADTNNDFIIYWAVCLKTASSNHMPCFSIVVRREDNSIFASLPASDTRRTTEIYGNSLLHLPSPEIGDPPVSYYITLVNTTGADCTYNNKAFFFASLMIVCID